MRRISPENNGAIGGGEMTIKKEIDREKHRRGICCQGCYLIGKREQADEILKIIEKIRLKARLIGNGVVQDICEEFRQKIMAMLEGKK